MVASVNARRHGHKCCALSERPDLDWRPGWIRNRATQDELDTEVRATAGGAGDYTVQVTHIFERRAV